MPKVVSVAATHMRNRVAMAAIYNIYAQCGGRDSPVCVQCGGRGGHIYAQCGGCDGLPILWPWRPGQSGCDYLLKCC